MATPVAGVVILTTLAARKAQQGFRRSGPLFYGAITSFLTTYRNQWFWSKKIDLYRLKTFPDYLVPVPDIDISVTNRMSSVPDLPRRRHIPTRSPLCAAKTVQVRHVFFCVRKEYYIRLQSEFDGFRIPQGNSYMRRLIENQAIITYLLKPPLNGAALTDELVLLVWSPSDAQSFEVHWVFLNDFPAILDGSESCSEREQTMEYADCHQIGDRKSAPVASTGGFRHIRFGYENTLNHPLVDGRWIHIRENMPHGFRYTESFFHAR
jgi:hypothetical protein